MLSFRLRNVTALRSVADQIVWFIESKRQKYRSVPRFGLHNLLFHMGEVTAFPAVCCSEHFVVDAQRFGLVSWHPRMPLKPSAVSLPYSIDRQDEVFLGSGCEERMKT